MTKFYASYPFFFPKTLRTRILYCCKIRHGIHWNQRSAWHLHLNKKYSPLITITQRDRGRRVPDPSILLFHHNFIYRYLTFKFPKYLLKPSDNADQLAWLLHLHMTKIIAWHSKERYNIFIYIWNIQWLTLRNVQRGTRPS